MCRTLKIRRGRRLGVLWLLYIQLVKLDALQVAFKVVHLGARECRIFAPAAVEEDPEQDTLPLARLGLDTRQGLISWRIDGSWAGEGVTWRIPAGTRSHGEP